MLILNQTIGVYGIAWATPHGGGLKVVPTRLTIQKTVKIIYDMSEEQIKETLS